jgi:WXG100 family type VII secretion target
MPGFGHKVQADYDELATIANELSQEAGSVDDLTNKIMNMVGQLEGGGWIGRGAESFYAEMHDMVEPGLHRLVQALEDGSGAVKLISNTMSQAESEASAQFKF